VPRHGRRAAVHLPFGSQLAIGSRRELPVPVPRLRAQGRIAEIGTRDLAMDAGEAAALLLGAGSRSPAMVDPDRQCRRGGARILGCQRTLVGS
jgi:ATP/maltotriose-dependent transcriptional regulator MalT